MAEKIDLQMCSYGQFSEVQMLRGLDLNLRSGQGHINIHSKCRTNYQLAQPCDCSITHNGIVAIWISWNIDIRRSLNSRDSFPRRKFKNRTPTSCSPGPILSLSTIRFGIHAKTTDKNCPSSNFKGCKRLPLRQGWYLLIYLGTGHNPHGRRKKTLKLSFQGLGNTR